MNTTQRDFFRLIREAIFANPFSDRRLTIDLKALNRNEMAESDKATILAGLQVRVEQVLEELESSRGFAADKLTTDDRQLYRLGRLFAVFHRFTDRCDCHIQRQLEQSTPLTVPFAEEALHQLTACDLNEAEALHHFALFFQMRRAWYFIRRLVGSSSVMQRLRSELWTAVFSGNIDLYNRFLCNRMEDFSTLLLGETGVGKGMAAGAVGRSGYIPFNQRSGTFTESFAAAFTQINLSQYPAELIESELFGHRKGAFTGAVENHTGVFARCSPCGSILLDEIGDVAVPIQVKLLKVLEDRRFFPVGSHKEERFSGRVIAVTNRNLEELRQQGKFREDFYYRLCSHRIEIPPLRLRLAEDSEELGRLLRAAVHRLIGADDASCEELAQKMEQWFADNQPSGYPWPGNIRELEQCARQYLLTGNCHWRQVEAAPASGLAAEIETGSLSAVELQRRYCRLLYEKLGTYEAVAKRAGLDRRTVKKYVV